MDMRVQNNVVEKAAFPLGKIKFLAKKAAYGLIEAADGRDILFHCRSVIGVDFSGLGVGDRVRFSETQSGNVPLASTVFLSRNRRPVEW